MHIEVSVIPLPVDTKELAAVIKTANVDNAQVVIINSKVRRCRSFKVLSRHTSHKPPNHLLLCKIKSYMVKGDCSYINPSIQLNFTPFDQAASAKYASSVIDPCNP